jgi:hypothetical protein
MKWSALLFVPGNNQSQLKLSIKGAIQFEHGVSFYLAMGI